MTNLRPLVALLFGLAALLTLATLALPYMAGVAADSLLAVITSLTPPAAP